MTTQTPGADPGRRAAQTTACAECGTPATPGRTFCDGCGAVLRWSPGKDGAGASGSGNAAGGNAAGGGASGGTPATGGPVADGAHDGGAHPSEPEVAGAFGPATSFGPAAGATADGPDGQAPAGPPSSAGPGGQPSPGFGAPEPSSYGYPQAPFPPGPPAYGYPQAPLPTGPSAYGYPPGPSPAGPPAYGYPAGPPASGSPAGPPASGAPAGPSAYGYPPEPARDRDPDYDTEPLAPISDRDREQERARALLIPVADPAQRAPEAPSVAPVLPGRPAAARPVVQTPNHEPDGDGGFPCPWCGTGNRPDRHFCRRCAMSMAGRQEDPARLPWWRRLFGQRGVPWAGDRPRLRRNLGRILTWLAGAVALTLVIVGAFQLGDASQAVRDHFSKRAQVSPDSVAASHSFGGHDPKKAFDKVNNTWWGPGVAGAGDGEWIEARFQQPTRLLDVLITSGISTQPADLPKAALPHRIEVLITTADGHKKTRFITLDQSSGAQPRSFRVGSVTSVRFILRSAYAISSTKQVSIAEIELFGRSTSSNS